MGRAAKKVSLILQRPIVATIVIVASILFLAYLITPEMNALYEQSVVKPKEAVMACLDINREPDDCF